MFSVGDRVRCMQPHDGNPWIMDQCGTIWEIGSGGCAGFALVIFDNQVHGHNAIPEYAGRCWWVPFTHLELVTDKVMDSYFYMGHAVNDKDNKHWCYDMIIKGQCDADTGTITGKVVATSCCVSCGIMPRGVDGQQVTYKAKEYLLYERSPSLFVLSQHINWNLFVPDKDLEEALLKQKELKDKGISALCF